MGNGNRGNIMIIKNGLVFTPEGKFEKKDLYVEGEYVAKETTDNKEVEAEGCYVIPGLVDIHFHGCVRHDMCDGTEESIQALADYEAANGVLAICPATMTIPEEELFQAMKAAKGHKNGKGADLVGINMEGPFINKEKKGAQKEEDIKLADVELFHKLQEAAGGLIKLVDLAPETEGAMDFINQVKDEVHVSIAHTMADYDTASEAIRRGADHITHLYNAMPPLNHREPGVIGAARDSDCYVELICDGVHIHPSCVRATFEMFTDKRIVLISDSMMATGMEDGQYELGGQPVTVVGKRCNTDRRRSHRRFCNKPNGLYENGSQRNAYSIRKCSPMCNSESSKSIGIDDKYGSLEEGKYANAVVLDKDLNIVSIIQKGQVK